MLMKIDFSAIGEVYQQRLGDRVPSDALVGELINKSKGWYERAPVHD